MLDGWSRIDIAGKSADVFDPPTKPRFGLLFLHGIGGETLADDVTYTKELRASTTSPASPSPRRPLATVALDRLCTTELDPAVTPEKYLLQLGRASSSRAAGTCAGRRRSLAALISM